MVFTPSRSKASTRISLPNMGRPNSARSGAGGALAFNASVVWLITFYCLTGDRGTKKPTAVSSRGFLSKILLFATSANGAACYDDDQGQNDLSNKTNHWPKC